MLFFSCVKGATAMVLPSLSGQEQPQCPCAEPMTDIHGHAGSKDKYREVDCRAHSS